LKRGAGLAIYYRHLDDYIVVSGKTYPYRELIRGFGGTFENSDRVWHIPHSEASIKAIDQLCRSVGGGPLKAPTPSQANPSPLPSPAATDQKTIPPSVTGKPESAKKAADENPQQLVNSSELGLTVGDLMQQAHLAIQAAFPRSVWVIGEIQNYSMRKSGAFFQLADLKEGASQSATMTVNTTMWSSQARSLAQKLGADVLEGILQDGMKIRILAQVSFYRDRGQVSLNVLDIDPRFTKGSLALAREELLRELRQKGVDRANASRPLSAFPLSIGLISAEDSRAKSDFIHQLYSYGFPGEILFYAAQMQGEKTLSDVVRGIECLAKAGCDLIILTRGGGSLADLRWFDSREIAMAIIQCQLPVIAAIGHQDDVCVAEEVAYRREKTPTAAADFILSVLQKTRERLENSALVMARILQGNLQQQITRLHQLKELLRLGSHQQLNLQTERLSRQIYLIQQHLAGQQHRLSQQLQTMSHEIRQQSEQKLYALKEQNLTYGHRLRQIYQQELAQSDLKFQKQEQRLYSQAKQYISHTEQTLVPLEKTLAQNDPRPWLNRGWTRLEFMTGRTIRSIDKLTIGQQMQARLLDGLIKMTITDIEATTAKNVKQK